MLPGDVLICSEVSRLGRTILDNLDFLAKCHEKKLKVYFTKTDISVDDSINSQILIFAHSLAAQMERELLSQRTKGGLDHARSKGVILGRPNNISKLDQHKDRIRRDLKNGIKQDYIAKQLNCTKSHLCNYIKKYKLKD
jgi:DNA invertase Pin-like site-specific DNA recombinase